MYERKLSGSLAAQQAQFFKRVLGERPAPYDIPEGELEVLRLADTTFAVALCRPYRLAGATEEKALGKAADCLARRADTYGWQLYSTGLSKGMLLLLYAGERQEEDGFAARLRRLLLEANEALCDDTGVRCRFAVGGVGSDMKQLPALAARAEAVLEREFFTASRELLPVHAAGDPAAPVPYPAGLVAQLLDGLFSRLGRAPGFDVGKELAAILDELAKSNGASEAGIKLCMGEIVISVLRQNPPAEPGAPGLGELLAGLNAVNSLEEAKTVLAKAVEGILARTARAETPQNPNVARAMEYIQAHYSEDLGLAELAEKLALTPSYLSRLLKKETGKNFTDLLAGMRITAAKQLLTFSDLRVAEVGERVGYTDYTYFYQVFKRFEQISPSEYKKQNKNTL